MAKRLVITGAGGQVGSFLAGQAPKQGFDVVALNVTKLRTDNVDPREYMGRLDEWRTRVEKSGGRWRVINDLEHLDGVL